MTESTYVMKLPYLQSEVQITQDQRQGPMILLNGGSNLALKKLFEGQMQAFRIDIILEMEEWDKSNLEFKTVERNLKMAEGGFFYLKLLFTKETT